MRSANLSAWLALLIVVSCNLPAPSDAAARKSPAKATSVPLIQEITPGIVEYNRGARAGGRHTRRSGLVRSPYSQAINYTGGGGDYVGQTEGISRWPDGHTIKVYVAPGRPSFPGMVANCFNQWSRATGGRINYRLVNSASDAEYMVTWTARQREGYEGTEAGLTTTDTFVDPDSEQELIDHAQTRILTRVDGRTLSDRDVAETTLHEIGHGLGIEGHSSNPSDIMYYAVSSRQSGHLTNRDCNTIAKLYAF